MGIFQLLEGSLDRSFLVGREFVAEFLELVLGLENHRISLIHLVDFLALLLISFGISLGLSFHPFNLLLAQAAGSFDADGLLLAGSLILGRDLQDAVGVDVKCHLNLWHTTTCRGNAGEVEVADSLVLRCHRTLTLQHVYRHFGLVVGRSREHFALPARDCRVGINQLGHHAAERLDTHRQRSHIQQHDVAYPTLFVEDCALDGSTDGNDLVRIDTLGRNFAEEVLDQLLHGRNP